MAKLTTMAQQPPAPAASVVVIAVRATTLLAV